MVSVSLPGFETKEETEVEHSDVVVVVIGLEAGLEMTAQTWRPVNALA